MDGNMHLTPGTYVEVTFPVDLYTSSSWSTPITCCC